MEDIAKTRVKIRKSRHNRVRQIVTGTSDRPRLCVRRSLKHAYAQIVDDVSGQSIALVSTQSKELAKEIKGKTKIEASKIIGQKIGEIAKEKGIEKVVFDRGGYLYHGRIKALADSAREAGLVF